MVNREWRTEYDEPIAEEFDQRYDNDGGLIQWPWRTTMRCAIAMLDAHTGQGKAIYCHHEGHPEMTGRMLQHHYATEEKTRELIELGHISWLGTETHGPDLTNCPSDADPREYVLTSFRLENPPQFTFAYHRDGNTEWERCRMSSFVAANTEELTYAIDWWEQFDAHYVYCWTPDGWYCVSRDPANGAYSYEPIPTAGDW